MLVLLVWDSSCASCGNKGQAHFGGAVQRENLLVLKKYTNRRCFGTFKAVTVPTQSTMLRENLETLLVIIKSIFPLVQSSIIRLKASR